MNPDAWRTRRCVRIHGLAPFGGLVIFHFLFVLLFSSVSFAQTMGATYERPEWALPVKVLFDGEYAVSHLGAFVPEFLAALDLVIQHPIHPQHFFDWSGDRSSLKNTLVHITFTDSTSDVYRELFTGEAVYNPTYTTRWAVHTANGVKTTNVYVIVALDHLLKKRLAPDDFAKLTNLLGEAFYGSIHRLLGMNELGSEYSARDIWETQSSFLQKLHGSQAYLKLSKLRQKAIANQLESHLRVMHRMGVDTVNRCGGVLQ